MPHRVRVRGRVRAGLGLGFGLGFGLGLGVTDDGGRGRDECPIGDLWAALYRGVPYYMLYTEACAPREAEAVMSAP